MTGLCLPWPLRTKARRSVFETEALSNQPLSESRNPQYILRYCNSGLQRSVRPERAGHGMDYVTTDSYESQRT